MSYIRYDKDNVQVDPQPSAIDISVFDGDEGWTQIDYKNWNADYQARNSDNTTRTPAAYQARNSDNTTRTPSVYQRHDKDNTPITG